jgi:lipopolysaccharide export system permease protein
MILQRYIATHLVRGWLLVLLVLASVFGLIVFMQELDHTRFDYDGAAVARYTLLSLPQQMVSLAPVIALLGSILALSALDRANELTVISCTGFPPSKLLGAIAVPTALMMLFLWLCMEFLTPRLQQSAEQMRHSLRYRNEVKIPYGGVWSTDGRRYIHLGKMFQDGTPGDIELFEFGGGGVLHRALHAETAQVGPDRHWLLLKVREKRRVEGVLVTRHHETMAVENMWAARELPTLTHSSDTMALSVLYRYCQYQARNGQPVQRLLGSFWQKLLMPLTAGAMVLLATPIAVDAGSRRGRSFGLNLGIGALVGILFYLGAQIIFALGQLLEIPLPLVGVLPALLVLICALALLRRMRW